MFSLYYILNSVSVDIYEGKWVSPIVRNCWIRPSRGCVQLYHSHHDTCVQVNVSGVWSNSFPPRFISWCIQYNMDELAMSELVSNKVVLYVYICIVKVAICSKYRFALYDVRPTCRIQSERSQMFDILSTVQSEFMANSECYNIIGHKRSFSSNVS
jgi:hypothetical protein